jgi:hypothetical protein
MVMQQTQSQLDFTAGEREGRKRFVEARRAKMEWHPAEYRDVQIAVIAVMRRDGDCDADRIREYMEAGGTWQRLRKGRHAIGCALGTLVSNHCLVECGRVKSCIPSNKGRKINLYGRGRLYGNLDDGRPLSFLADDQLQSDTEGSV